MAQQSARCRGASAAPRRSIAKCRRTLSAPNDSPSSVTPSGYFCCAMPTRRAATDFWFHALSRPSGRAVGRAHDWQAPRGAGVHVAGRGSNARIDLVTARLSNPAVKRLVKKISDFPTVTPRDLVIPPPPSPSAPGQRESRPNDARARTNCGLKRNRRPTGLSSQSPLPEFTRVEVAGAAVVTAAVAPGTPDSEHHAPRPRENPLGYAGGFLLGRGGGI